MMTKRILCCVPALLLAACEKKPESASAVPEAPAVIENGTLLRTGLPAESLEGTPIPIAYAGIPARLVPPEHVRGPGSFGVQYGLVPDGP